MYTRKVGDKSLTFQVSGLLWNRSLVMRDVETGSLWSHILGECMQGELEGETLETIPSVMTTWEDWKEEHPKTKVLDLPRSHKAYDREFYRRLGDFVLGIVLDGTPKVYPFDALAELQVVQDRIGDRPVVVVFDRESTRATIHSRRLGDDEVEFESALRDGHLVDKATSSRWDRRSLTAVSGPLKGKRLEALPGIVSLREAWRIFHPESESFENEEANRKSRFR